MSEVTYIKCDFCQHEFPSPMKTAFRCDVRVVLHPETFEGCATASVREWQHLCETCHAELFKAIDNAQRAQRDRKAVRAA